MRRHYSDLLREYLDLFPSVAIVGVRQCGKTTMLGELAPEWKVFDLEKESDFQVISRDPELFLRLHPGQVAFDESQLLPELFPALRVAIDADRGKTGRFIITGSSSPDLVRTVSESLAGRVALIELAPFSASEAYSRPPSSFFELIAEKAAAADFAGGLKVRLTPAEVHEFWLRGGYPEPWIRNSRRFTGLWMDNYLRTYLQRDVMRLFPGLNERKYRHFLRLLSNISGRIINYSNIAGLLGVSAPTVKEYLEIAHGTFFWRNIPPYEKNAVKRIVRHPRGYLRDSGVHHSFLHLRDLESLLSHPDMGSSWEGMVIENILKGFHARGIHCDYYFYRTGAGAEVDLVLEGDFGLLPIEIKYRQAVSLRELRAIRDFIKERNCRIGIVVNNDDRVRLYDENLIGVPFGAL